MSPRDVSSYEMSNFHHISDVDLDAVRAGRVSNDDPRLGAFARFLRDLDEAHPEPSTQALEGSHVAAMMEAARLMADNGEPVARPASKAYGPDDQASGLPKPRRSIMWNTLFASMYAKVGAGALALLVAFTGTAAAGVLPDPVQSAVAGAAASVGIALPDPAAAEEETVPAPEVDPEAGVLDEDDLGDVGEDGDEAEGLEDADEAEEDAESSGSSSDADDDEGDDSDEGVDDDADEGTDDADDADDADADDADDGDDADADDADDTDDDSDDSDETDDDADETDDAEDD